MISVDVKESNPSKPIVKLIKILLESPNMALFYVESRLKRPEAAIGNCGMAVITDEHITSDNGPDTATIIFSGLPWEEPFLIQSPKKYGLFILACDGQAMDLAEEQLPDLYQS